MQVDSFKRVGGTFSKTHHVFINRRKKNGHRNKKGII